MGASFIVFYGLSLYNLITKLSTNEVQSKIMKTIRELSEILGISKESIYKKIKYQLKVELKDHVFKGSGGALIDDVGESLILQSLRRERAAQEDEMPEEKDVDSTVNSNLEQPNIVNSLQVESVDIISILKQQLEEKDRQIVSLMNLQDEQMQNKDLQIERLLNINEQLITTFQNEQKIKIAGALRLSEPSDSSADQEATAPVGDQTESQKSIKKSFWNRILKK